MQALEGNPKVFHASALRLIKGFALACKVVRSTTLVLLRKTLGRALDCFPLGNHGFPKGNNLGSVPS